MEPTLRSAVGDSLRGKRVLDVGCGDGSLSAEYLKWGAKSVVAVDSNAHVIRSCKAKYADRRLDFHVRSPIDMGYHNEFDAAMAIFVLPFCENYEWLKTVLKSIAKALKPNGVMFAYVPNGDKNIRPMKGECEATDDVKEMPITFYYCETYEKALREAGFDDIVWCPPRITKEAQLEYGEPACHDFVTPPRDVVFRAVKQ
ncbi:CRE-PRMT-6 protein [Aphelenchoides avenae]|nr:CRE-PRMT-6 protein [Aphelenchus avenae]